MKLNTYLIPQIKINPKWNKDLNVRAKIIKLLEVNIGEKLYNIAFGNNFLDIIPETQAITTRKIDYKLDYIKYKYKLDYIKIKKFYTKNTIKSEKQPMEWKRYLHVICLIKG